jgi:hypothetical protein
VGQGPKVGDAIKDPVGEADTVAVAMAQSLLENRE